MAVQPEERFYETNRAQLLRWLPWLHLFRAFRIALDPRKIVLGALAAFLLVQGDRLIDTLPFAPGGGGRGEVRLIPAHNDFLRLSGLERQELVEQAIVANRSIDRSPVLWPLRT